MSVPYYQGKEVVFVASIVIGCIQLGATVDYAILMTSRYQKERGLGKSKKESIAIAHKTSMKSIVISGCSFFAATFGVGLYTQVDMIGKYHKPAFTWSCNQYTGGIVYTSGYVYDI